MELGEEIVGIIPIVIGIIIVIVFMNSLHTEHLRETTSTNLHREGLLKLEKIYYRNNGKVNPSNLELENSTEYHTKLVLENINGDRWTYGEEKRYPVTVSLPILIENQSLEPGKVTLKIKHT